MSVEIRKYNWLVLVPRDPKELEPVEPTHDKKSKTPKRKRIGFHDSGYRFLRVIGVRFTDDSKPGEKPKLIREELGQWHDHVQLYGPCNIDVTPEGEIRLCAEPWGAKGSRWVVDGPPYVSSCTVYCEKPEVAAHYMLSVNKIHFDVRRQVYGSDGVSS